jgi:hypothetical protein
MSRKKGNVLIGVSSWFAGFNDVAPSGQNSKHAEELANVVKFSVF